MTTAAFAAEESSITASALVAAIERTWASVQRRHADVPDVVVTLAGGGHTGVGLKLGHFAAKRWTVGEREGVHELFIGGEGLKHGAVELLGTVLHEAAHAMAHHRGVKDTSRQGRWHNAKFAEIAREFGLVVAKDDRIGWSLTTVPAAVQAEYVAELVELDVELNAYRRSDVVIITTGGGTGAGGGAAGGSGSTTTRRPAFVCGCREPRRLRIAKATAELGPITCGLCGEDFAPEA